MNKHGVPPPRNFMGLCKKLNRKKYFLVESPLSRFKNDATCLNDDILSFNDKMLYIVGGSCGYDGSILKTDIPSCPISTTKH